MDDAEAGRLATKHLISLGHKRISAAFVFDDRQGHLRYQGFMDCLDAHGIPFAEQRVLWLSTQERETLFTVSKERVSALLAESTAVVCYNDKLRWRCWISARSKGFAYRKTSLWSASTTAISPPSASRR
jgi:GntR family transcriptional regulator of arabinose operon